MYKQLFLIFILFFSLSQCTIQKRTVNKGYFVQWHLNKKVKNQSSFYKEQDSNLFIQKFDINTISAIEIKDSLRFTKNTENSVMNLISKIEEKEMKMKRILESNLKNNTQFRSKNSTILMRKLPSKSVFEKSESKEKDKKVRIYFLLAGVSFILMLLILWLALFSNLNAPEWFYDIFLITLLFITFISFVVFTVLAFVYLTISLIKPKDKKTQKAQT